MMRANVHAMDIDSAQQQQKLHKQQMKRGAVGVREKIYRFTKSSTLRKKGKRALKSLRLLHAA
jgi:hypothetical protein